MDDEKIGNIDAKLCDKWGVMTTISPASEAVRKFLYKPDWCVVVVGDLEKPQVSTHVKCDGKHQVSISPTF